jgi:hypothetical protein
MKVLGNKNGAGLERNHRNHDVNQVVARPYFAPSSAITGETPPCQNPIQGVNLEHVMTEGSPKNLHISQIFPGNCPCIYLAEDHPRDKNGSALQPANDELAISP